MTTPDSALNALSASLTAVDSPLAASLAEIVADGTFLRVWGQHRQPPDARIFRERTIIDIPNPFYDQTLVPERYRHLLLQPAQP